MYSKYDNYVSLFIFIVMLVCIFIYLTGVNRIKTSKNNLCC